jgi:putative IMPACT (imprinted ancient) family translation regulator
MLAVLQGSGLGDIVVVVTRYFGGTKLGTGGLVRAYGDTVKEVLAILPRAEKVPTHRVMMALPYNMYERVKRLVEAQHGRILDEDFAADVTITAQFVIEQFSAFEEALRELSHGQLEAVIVETNPETIMPTGTLAAQKKGEG